MTIPPNTDPVRKAEYNAANVDRVRVATLNMLRKNGCILPDYVIEAIVEQVLEESLATRRRIGYMVHVFTEAFGEECTPERLERLEICVLLHERDAANGVVMPVEVVDEV